MERAALIVAAALFLVSGTAFAASQQVPPSVKDSPDYQSGYSDGCGHAVWGSGPDRPRSDRPVAYRAGWYDGFNTCQRGGSMRNPGGKLDNVGGNVPNPNNGN